ncbi:MAG TPA: polysaccharide deacetylase family protein [Candidatus Limnocylindrales bacterium]|nr:polysaccharide deacetylase family protein [Candidatus Limnocylindrales bacterium]
MGNRVRRLALAGVVSLVLVLALGLGARTPVAGAPLAGAPLAGAPVAGAPLARIVSRGPASAHVVALTFDDAWDPAATGRIFATLRANGVAATFFPVGKAVAAAPDLWRSIAQAGYPIANHSDTHPTLTSLSDEAVSREIVDARSTVERVTGRPMAPFLRPPNGAIDDRVRGIAERLGFATIVMWAVASSDWTEPGAAAVVQRSLAGTDGSIVLLHAGPASTVAALPAIIAGYRARGFSFVAVPQLLAAPD